MAFTYFFRDRQVYDLIARQVVPELIGRRYIDIWDAGCAHGPEPFSLAITLRENMSHFIFRNVRIFASDNEPSGRFARVIESGTYPEDEISRIPEAVKYKYFTSAGMAGFFRISDEVRRSVRYCRHDLLSYEPLRTGFSLVMCKNVLIHFSEAQRANILGMFHASLRDGGYLITEQTQKLPAGMEALFEEATPTGRLFRKRETGIAAPSFDYPQNFDTQRTTKQLIRSTRCWNG